MSNDLLSKVFENLFLHFTVSAGSCSLYLSLSDVNLVFTFTQGSSYGCNFSRTFPPVCSAKTCFFIVLWGWGWDRVHLLLVHPFLWGYSHLGKQQNVGISLICLPALKDLSFDFISPHPKRSTNKNSKLPNWQMSWRKSNSRALLTSLSSCFT